MATPSHMRVDRAFLFLSSSSTQPGVGHGKLGRHDLCRIGAAGLIEHLGIHTISFTPGSRRDISKGLHTAGVRKGDVSAANSPPSQRDVRHGVRRGSERS